MAEVEHDHEAEVILYEVAISLAGSLMYTGCNPQNS